MIKKVNMKRFIYFFVFFLLLTLSLFFIMNSLGSKTIQESLVNSSKNQLAYTESILDGIISEASLYGIQYTADTSVRFYQSKIQEMNNYDAQMKKNDIYDRISAPLLSSHVSLNLSVSTGKRTALLFSRVMIRLPNSPFRRSRSEAGRLLIIICIIFQSTLIFMSLRTLPIFNTLWALS